MWGRRGTGAWRLVAAGQHGQEQSGRISVLCPARGSQGVGVYLASARPGWALLCGSSAHPEGTLNLDRDFEAGGAGGWVEVVSGRDHALGVERGLGTGGRGGWTEMMLLMGAGQARV